MEAATTASTPSAASQNGLAALLVHLDIDGRNGARLAVAADLAARCGAAVTGIAACDPQPAPYFYGAYGDQVLADDRARLAKRLTELEAEFRAALASHPHEVAWRAAIAGPTAFVARACRSADLVVIGAPSDRLGDPARDLDAGDLVMQAGRPLLIVPDYAEPLALRRAVLAWKDCREARRAVVDALPLLGLAGGVVIAAIDEGDDGEAAHAGAADIAAFLTRHGIAAEATLRESSGDVAADLDRIAAEHGADLMVAGAYGHSRFSEWVFGGVTRALLARPNRCLLLSH